jgi:hypothetical protein
MTQKIKAAPGRAALSRPADCATFGRALVRSLRNGRAIRAALSVNLCGSGNGGAVAARWF